MYDIRHFFVNLSPLPEIFSDTEGHYCCLKPFYSILYLGKRVCAINDTFTHESENSRGL